MKKTVDLKYQGGVIDMPLEKFVKQKAKQCSPVLSWVEPRPGVNRLEDLGPLANFHGLECDTPNFNFPLEEARLFWENGMLHAVSLNDATCQFFECHERTEMDNEGEFSREIYRILLRRDWERFSIDKPKLEEVLAIEYCKAARLFAWRLLPYDAKNIL